ncbi:MAG TPA: hydrolase Nlp/P60 [Bacteroidetes bacterium]|nr:hydrolase Nlp/P60 [Bacteroidota bacterium]
MDKAICILPLVPVREKPSDKSQMINQLLFGDLVQVRERNKDWVLMETIHDNYPGWVDEKQLAFLSAAFFERMEKEEAVFLSEKFVDAHDKNGDSLSLIMGNRLPAFEKNVFFMGDTDYSLPKNVRLLRGKQKQDVVIETAKRYLGSPYLWGGRSYFGNDCSGFTQIVYRMCGYNLLRDSSQQAEQGVIISFIEEAKIADLAFFENEEGCIMHVGILLNNHQIIHSSGQVRIDAIDHEGIFNENLKKYTHKLRFIRRIIA